MAKKTTKLKSYETLSVAEKLKKINQLSSKINEENGRVVMGILGESKELQERLTPKFIPFPSIELCEATGGGLPIGKISIITGTEDSGKTSLLLETIGKYQHSEAGINSVVLWIESENSLNNNYIYNVLKVDRSRFCVQEASNSITAEKVFNIIEAAIKSKAVDIVVINSLKMLIPQAEADRSMEEMSVAEQARINSRMVNRFSGLCAEYGTTIALVNHLGTMIGSMSRDPLAQSGGRAIRYANMLTLDLRSQSIGESDPISREDGKKIKVTVRKNHSVPEKNPYVSCIYYVVYNEGTETILPMIDTLVAQGKLVKGGAWISLIDQETGEVIEKWNGKKALRDCLKADVDKYNMFMSMITNAYNPDLIQDLPAEEIEAIRKQDSEDRTFLEEVGALEILEDKESTEE